MKLDIDYVHKLPVLIKCESCNYKQVWFEYHYRAYKMIQSYYGRGGYCPNCRKEGSIKVFALKREVAEKLKDKFPDKIAPEFFEEIGEIIKK